MANINNGIEKLPDALIEFAYFDYKRLLPQIAAKAQNENWQNKNETNRQPYPILLNYIVHTYKRLAHLYNTETTYDEKSKWIKFNNGNVLFNLGLFTNKFNELYLFFKINKNTIKNTQPYYCVGVFESCDTQVLNFGELPIRAKYFDSVDQLIYDTNLQIEVNWTHILEDEENKKRIPKKYLNTPELLYNILNGALLTAKKRIAANYKVAVPQYYDNKNQLLIPLCFGDTNQTDLVLAVDKYKNLCYKGYTCLTIDQAYNNARLIAKPETDWLSR